MRSISFFAMALLSCSVGCKGKSEGAVTGTVTLNDKPLANALVRFIPQGDTQGLGGTARTDANGKYTLDNPRGGKEINPGVYKVVISKSLRPDGSEPDPNKPPIESDARETLPANYSNEVSTTLTATVGADKKSHDFPLTSVKKP